MLQPIQESRFEYKRYPCVVLFMPYGYRCGYVGLPKISKYYKKEYDDIPVKCHEGLTYSRSMLHLQNDKDTWWIGFDCAHYNDLNDYDKAVEYFGFCGENEALKIFNDILNDVHEPLGTIKTLEFVENECKKIVEQIILLESEE